MEIKEIRNLSTEEIMKKIALVVDTDNWAFANIARNVKKNLSKYYDFKIIPIAFIRCHLP